MPPDCRMWLVCLCALLRRVTALSAPVPRPATSASMTHARMDACTATRSGIAPSPKEGTVNTIRLVNFYFRLSIRPTTNPVPMTHFSSSCLSRPTSVLHRLQHQAPLRGPVDRQDDGTQLSLKWLRAPSLGITGKQDLLLKVRR